MSEDAAYARKVRRASQLLFFQRHAQPGVKGWELKRALGRDYVKVLELLDSHLEGMGLQVKTVYEEPEPPKQPTEEQLERARFYISLRGGLAREDLRTSGWRVDDVAGLAVAVAYVVSRHGKAPRKDVEQLLGQKFPDWRVELNLDRYVRRGYLAQDEEGMLYLGWRARAEVDQKALLNLILGREVAEQPTG